MQLQYNSVEGGTPEEHSWADPTIPKKAANKNSATEREITQKWNNWVTGKKKKRRL